MKETRAAFARRLGVEKSTITRAVQAGRLDLDEDGLLDVEASLRRWQSTQAGRTDVAARHAARRGRAIPEAVGAPSSVATARRATADDEITADLPADADSPEGRTGWKAEILRHENALIRLEIALRQGKRYPLADVQREAQSLGAMLRAGFERLIDQTAPRLAVAGSRDERRRLIGAELRTLRAMIRGELPRALRRLRQAGGKGKPA